MIFEKVIYISIILLFLAYYIYRYVKYSNKYALMNIGLQIIAFTLLVLIYGNSEAINPYMQLLVFACGYIVPATTLVSIKYNINYIYEFESIVAKIFAITNNNHKAINIYEEVLKNYKKYDVYKNLGYTYLKNKDWQYALSNLSRAVEIKPKNYKIYYKIAFIQYELGNYDEAITILNNILKIKPNYLLASNLLAYILIFNKDNYSKALKVYFQLLENNKKDAKTCYNIGATYIKQNQNKNAKKFLETAIKYNSRLYNAYYLLGYIHFVSKEYELAEQCLLTSSKGLNTYAKSYYMLARLYMVENEKGKATNCLNLAIEREDSFATKMQNEPIFESIKGLVNGVDTIEKISNEKIIQNSNKALLQYSSRFEEINIDNYLVFANDNKK